MKKHLTGFLLSIGVFIFYSMSSSAQSKLDSLLPVRGFCIDAPRPAGLDSLYSFY